jgi:hypothetical protein
VIADSDAKAKEIFDDKIRFAYDNLPSGCRQAQYTEVESMHALGSRTARRSRSGPALGA